MATVGKSSGPASGSLLMIGGGRFGTEIREELLRLGRGPDGRAEWVFIPTAESDEVVSTLKPLGFIERESDRVTLLHTRDPAEADSDTFVAPLRTATAVFIFGGRHYRLVDSYAGTRTEAALGDVLDRGGLLSGSSAGSTILGSYLVRGAPSEDNTILMWPGYETGFGYMANVTVDQHVTARNREADLAQVVAAHPELLGIGIDEDTAVAVQGNAMRVIGAGQVFITDGIVRDGKPYYELPAGTRFDLATRSVIAA